MKAEDSINVTEIWGGDTAPSVDLMRLQMEDLNGWTNSRVKRLCASAGITLEGLCAMAGVYGRSTIAALVRQAEKREQEERARKAVPAHVRRARRLTSVALWKWPWPIALHFSKIEKFLYEQKFATPTTIGVEELSVSKLFKERPAEPVALN